MIPRSKARRGGLLALWLALLLSLACASEAQPLWADPGLVRFDPDRSVVEIEIHNISGTIRPIGSFEIRGEDWDSLRFIEDSLPRTVPSHDSVVVRLAISTASFRTRPGVYRSGRASLRFASDQHQFELPIEFVGTDAGQSGAPPPWLVLALLASIGATILALARRGTLELRNPPLAAALAALLLLLATMPLGDGLCLGRIGERVGPRELAQCRAGLGGYELTLLAADPGLWWWLVALASVAATLAWVRDARARVAALSLACVRTLGLALVLASFVTAMAPAGAAAVEVVLTQLRSTTLGSLTAPAWGLIALPIACAALVGLAAMPTRANASSRLGAPPSSSPGAVASLERLERLGWAALITTLFLGGWSIPGLSARSVPPLTHAGMLACELTVFAIKVALVDLGLARLARRITADDSALLRTHARWTIPLLLANLLAVALWRVT